MTTTEAENKAFVLKAFDTLFNKRDYAAAERFWSPAYIQHSAHIAPGREGLFELVKAAPKELHYENALIVADGDHVMLHGRFSGIGQPVNWVVADILRIENGRALGRHPRRGDARVFEERAAHVRGQISRLTAHHILKPRLQGERSWQLALITSSRAAKAMSRLGAGESRS
jgi:predicted SnoaL-like aldol condensation-catalyzing enzyme